MTTLDSALIDWVREKLADAKKSLSAREQMEKTWRGGTDLEWAAAAELHPSTRGKPILKADRIKLADSQKRIVAKCRRDVEMFEAILSKL